MHPFNYDTLELIGIVASAWAVIATFQWIKTQRLHSRMVDALMDDEASARHVKRVMGIHVPPSPLP